MGAFVLQIPESKLRIVAPDVGGGFGSKIFHYAEEALLTWAAGKIGRPIKWTADRSESFMSDAQGRDHVSHAELAMDKDGKFLALKVSTIANMGAYLSTFAPCVPTYLYGTLLAGSARRRSMSRSRRSSPIPLPSMPIAAPDGRKPPSCWSGWSTRRPAR
jgi:carbon-monoxide dehydrogenase large subunit